MCTIDKCEFCSLSTEKRPVLPRHLQDIDVNDLYQDLIYNGEHFYVKPDISPVVAKHLLVIPKKHIFCMASLPSLAMEELEFIKGKIKQYYQMFGMNYMFFEHGCCEDREPGSSCIHHAHLHAIPISKEDEKKILLTSLNVLGQENIVKKNDIEGVAYLYLETTYSPSLYWEDKIQRSQFFRILIAETIGNAQRSRWQNCLVNSQEKEKSKEWLNLCKGVYF